MLFISFITPDSLTSPPLASVSRALFIFLNPSFASHLYLLIEGEISCAQSIISSSLSDKFAYVACIGYLKLAVSSSSILIFSSLGSCFRESIFCNIVLSSPLYAEISATEGI